MAAKKIAFEAHAGASVVTTLPDGTTLRLGEGKSYETADPNEIAALDGAHGVKRAGKDNK